MLKPLFPISLVVLCGCSLSTIKETFPNPIDASVDVSDAGDAEAEANSPIDAREAETCVAPACNVPNECHTCQRECTTVKPIADCNRCFNNYIECVISSLENTNVLNCSCLCEQQFYERIAECFADAGYHNELCLTMANDDTQFPDCIASCPCN